MVMGGGAYEENGKNGITSIPHRNNVIGVVFDVFYDEGGEGRANELHQEFGKLLPVFSNGKDIRMTWGSFGEIKMGQVWEKYYGNIGLYQRLQKLKNRVDPRDVFHTPFTVQRDVSDGLEGSSAKRQKIGPVGEYCTRADDAFGLLVHSWRHYAFFARPIRHPT